MALLKVGGVASIVVGVTTIVAGIATGLGGPLVGGLACVASGVGMLVIGRQLAPVMQSTRAVAEQSGMELGWLGTPKFGPAMAQARSRMEQAQASWRTLSGDPRLRYNGLDGEAVVRAARDTGRRQNLNPVYTLDLIVTPRNGPAYELLVESEVNTLAVAQCVPGTRVPLKIRAEQPRDIWIDWLAVAGTS
jgi:hypothetical protein